jgi:long-chain acyl-CoA synthetase
MITRLFEIPFRQHQLYPKDDALASKENGTWKTISTGDFIAEADKFSLGLLAMGLSINDKIAIISNNRPEWNIMDIGMMQAGVVNVPVYTTLSIPEIIFILNDCEAKYLIVSSADLFAKTAELRKNVPSDRKSVV